VAVQAGRTDRHPAPQPSTAGFAGCLHVCAASPGPDGRAAAHATATPLHAVHSTTEGHFGVHLRL
jgi:hypothetical protein